MRKIYIIKIVLFTLIILIPILNINLNQRFSGNDNSNLRVALNRFRIYQKDFKYFYNENFKSKISYLLFI